MKHSIHTLAAAAALALALPAHAVATLEVSATDVVAAPDTDITVTLNWLLSEPALAQGLTVLIEWPASGLTFSAGQSMALGQTWTEFSALFADPDLSTPLTISAGSIYGSALLLSPVPVPLASTFDLKFKTGLVPGDYKITYDISFTDADFNEVRAKAFSTVTISAVPEADTAAMLAAGLAVMGLLARRRRA